MFLMSFLVIFDCSTDGVMGCSCVDFGDSIVSTGDAGEAGMAGGLDLGFGVGAMAKVVGL